jgi:hypothetical protein
MNATKETLQRFATKIHKHGNVRIGRANVHRDTKVGFYIGPNLEVATDTKGEMYFYLLGRLEGQKEPK